MYAQFDHSFMCTFRRIAILLLPKLNATCAVYTSLPGFCCKTTQAFPVSSTGYPIGSVVVCKINDFGGLFKSFTLCVIIEYPSVAVNILPILLYSKIHFKPTGHINLNTDIGYYIIFITDGSNADVEYGFPSDVDKNHCFGLSCVAQYPGGYKYGFQFLIFRSTNKVKARWIYGEESNWIDIVIK